jgi:cell division protein FtsI (penicillin-binding protein 3)
MALNSNRKPSRIINDSIDEDNMIPVTKAGYFKAIQTVMNTMQLPIDQNSTDWVKTFADKSKTRVEKIVVPQNAVPDLAGMGAKDAVFILESLGLNVQVVGRGKVISQNIKPGTYARKGSPVMISLQ